MEPFYSCMKERRGAWRGSFSSEHNNEGFDGELVTLEYLSIADRVLSISLAYLIM